MAGPTISSITILTATVPINGLFEATCAISGSYSNPYDFDAISLEGRFVDPNGHPWTPFPGYWDQQFTVITQNNTHGETYTAGATTWKQRFRPTIAGTWTFQLVATTPGGTTISASHTFVCSGALSPNPHLGPWKVDSNRLYRYEDGTWFAPVGHNYAHDDRDYHLTGTAGADDFLGRLGANGATATRIWFHPHFGTDIEEYTSGATLYSGWDNHYAGVAGSAYNLIAAWVMDYRMQKAMDEGLSVILVLQAQGPFSTESDAEFTHNPYKASNGGTVDDSDPTTVFTDGTALTNFQRRLRYMLARWGAYASLGLLEFGNEMASIGTSSKDGYLSSTVRSQLGSFLTALISYWKARDPWKHLWTLSQEIEPAALGGGAGSGRFDNLWLLASIDIGQLHRYHDSEESKNGDIGTSYQIETDFEARIGKPILHGERGLYRPGGTPPEADFNPTTSVLGDVKVAHLLMGTHFHNELWFDLVTKTRFGGHFWWGSYLRDDTAKNRTSGTLHGLSWAFPLDTHYVAVAAFLADEDLATWGAIRDITKTMSLPGNLFGGGMADSIHAWVWLRDEKNRYDSGRLPSGMTLASLTSVEPFAMGAASLISEEDFDLGNGAYLISVEPWATGLSKLTSVEPFNLGIAEITTPTINVRGMASGLYDVELWATGGAGGRVAILTATSAGGSMLIVLPSMTGDIALKITQGGLVGTPGRTIFRSVEPFTFGGLNHGMTSVEPFVLGAANRASFVSVEPFGMGFSAFESQEPFDLGGRFYLGTAPASPKLGWRDR